MARPHLSRPLQSGVVFEHTLDLRLNEEGESLGGRATQPHIDVFQRHLHRVPVSKLTRSRK